MSSGGRVLRGLPAVAVIFAAMVGAAAANAADVFRGQEIYESSCQVCHGDDGKGIMPMMPDFTKADGAFASNVELFNVINLGREVMPGFQGVLKEREILDVIAYIRTFY